MAAILIPLVIKFLRVRLAAMILLAAALNCVAQENVVLDYKGRLSVDGAPFTGTGHFMFALEGKNGEIFWSSGDFPYLGATANPANAMAIPVVNGEYIARLGAPGSAATALSAAEFRRVESPSLKVWFNDGTRGWQRAGDDIPLDSLRASLQPAETQPMTSAQADSILAELHNVRSLLEQQAHPAPPAPEPAPTIATVTLSGPSLGQSNAPLVLVEFTDYQCPFCKRFHEDVFPQLVKEYVDSGRLRIVSRNLPLPFHQNAQPAASAALCAYQQDRYWQMREKLFGGQADLSGSNLLAMATAASLDLPKFQACVDGKAFDDQVKKDSAEAGSAGISGTPSFVLGNPKGDRVTGVIIVGAQPLATFEGQIQKLLAAGK